MTIFSRLSIAFDTNTGVAKRFRRRHSRSRTHKWIQHNTLAQRQRGIDDLAQEGLGFQTRMIGDCSFTTGRAFALDDILEGVAVGFAT